MCYKTGHFYLLSTLKSNIEIDTDIDLVKYFSIDFLFLGWANPIRGR